MRIQLSEEAEEDLTDGAAFYEVQSPGLGRYFLDSLSSDIESLRLYAGIHQRHHGYFRLLSKRFPFAVFYRITEPSEDPTVTILAILDCRRDPALIEKKLRDR